MRLAPESRFLGEHPRLPSRIGKPVTQEELAEHLGISRGWYTRIEAGAPAVFSIALLNDLADLLLLSDLERVELMRLAKPELAPIVRRCAADLYDALGVVRRMVKRLWSATSEDEILHVAGEEARQLVPCFELIFARRISTPEETPFPRRNGNWAARLAAARADALRQYTPVQLARRDAVNLWQSAPAGALVSLDAYPPDLVRVYRLALQQHGIAWDSPVAAHIRWPGGSAHVGGTSTRPHDVTDLERSTLSTIADFASLALR